MAYRQDPCDRISLFAVQSQDRRRQSVFPDPVMRILILGSKRPELMTQFVAALVSETWLLCRCDALIGAQKALSSGHKQPALNRM